MAMAVDAKLLRATKFPAEFNQKVDMQKVNVEVMKKWIARRLSELLGSEDDVVIELCFNLLEGSRFPNVKELQIQLTGFLDKDTPTFCKDLWNLCLSAQSSPQGVPKELLEAKKQELMQEKADAETAAQAAQERRVATTTRESNIDEIRRRERGERFERGRGRGRGRGGRDPRGFDSRRPPSRSPSPPRRRSPYRAPARRDIDTYVPGGSSRAGGKADRRSRSLTRSDAGSSPSRSPLRRNRPNVSAHSRSRSPPRKHRRITSRDRNGREGAETDTRPKRGDRRRARSPSSSSEPRSPSPRLRRKRQRKHSLSRSPSPRPRRRRRSPSVSSNEFQRGDRGGKHSRGHRRPPSASPNSYRSGRRADIVRSRPRRDDPRLSRSPDEPPRRRRRSPSESRSRSRSGSRSRGQDRKRRNSLARYDPRKRRNTSSPPLSSDAERESKRRRRGASTSSRSDMSDVDGTNAARKRKDASSQAED